MTRYAAAASCTVHSKLLLAVSDVWHAALLQMVCAYYAFKDRLSSNLFSPLSCIQVVAETPCWANVHHDQTQLTSLKTCLNVHCVRLV